MMHAMDETTTDGAPRAPMVNSAMADSAMASTPTTQSGADASETRTGGGAVDYDVVIIGGGMAGGLCALALARLGLKIGVVDALAPDAIQTDSYDGRTTAIAYAAARLFRRLGLWEAIAPDAEPITDILVTDGARARLGGFAGVSLLDMHFDSRAQKTAQPEPLGWIVENRIIRAAIYDQMARARDIDLIAPARQTAMAVTPGHAAITLGNGRRMTARLIVAADGRSSPLRARAGIKVQQWRYPQTGIVATIAHERPHHGVAQELFLPSGPFAILPMTANRSSLVWTENDRAARAYLALDDARFLQAIAQRAGDYLGAIRLAGPRWSYPLALHLSTRLYADRLVLLGDAARAIHPIAGQGYNLGVKDVAALHDVLSEALATGIDIGHGATLARYERWRRGDSTLLALGTDGLNRAFSNDVAPLRDLRRLGLGLVNAVDGARAFFMRQAGGDFGDLPDLLAPDS